MGFFRGRLAVISKYCAHMFGSGGLYGENSHLDLAREIAEQGQNLAKKSLRYEDMEIYMFRLLLEYGKKPFSSMQASES